MNRMAPSRHVSNVAVRRIRRPRRADQLVILESGPPQAQAVPACAYEHMSEGSRWWRALLLMTLAGCFWMPVGVLVAPWVWGAMR